MTSRRWSPFGLMVVGLLAVTLWPFDFDLRPGAIRRGIDSIEWQWLYFGPDGVTVDADLVFNILLFVPVGAAFIHARPRSSALLACAVGAALSLAIEITQTLTPGRTPQLADLWRNSLGTAIGAGLFVFAQTRRRASGRSPEM